MVTFYLICAVVGGSILLVQLALTLLGLGGDHGIDMGTHVDMGGGHVSVGDVHAGDDVHHAAHDASWFFGILSFRAVIAAIAFFGVAGMAGLSMGLPDLASLLGAAVTGGAAMVAVAWLMNLLGSLDSSGNVNIRAAVGQSGIVYLSIPGDYIDAGKVSISVQGRTMEFLAKTAGSSIPSGTLVTVTKVLGSDTLEVAVTQRGADGD